MYVIINRIRLLLNRGKLILHEEGFLSLLKHLVHFVGLLLFSYSSYVIYENALNGPVIPCKVNNLTLRVITLARRK